MFEFVIIGGGIHGTYLSRLLVGELGWPPETVRVIDPYDCACGRWKDLTARTGMQFLRSPGIHHLGSTTSALRHFQRLNANEEWARSVGAMERPSLDLFNKHVDQICYEQGLMELRIKGEAVAVEPIPGGLRVKTTSGDFDTRRVVLAISSNDKLQIPAWARDIGPIARHIFEPEFTFDSIKNGQKVAVIGGGITAAQVALRVALLSPGNVQLITREALKVAELDSDPCWLGPKCQNRFAAEENYKRRREMIRQARNKGTVTKEVFVQIRKAEDSGTLAVMVREVDQARRTWDSQATLLDAYRNHLCQVSHVILATGFRPGRPGGALVEQMIARLALPTAFDGFPIVDKHLHWKHGVYVSGALAELEVGPPARNIIGARMAGVRMKRVFHSHQPEKVLA